MYNKQVTNVCKTVDVVDVVTDISHKIVHLHRAGRWQQQGLHVLEDCNSIAEQHLQHNSRISSTVASYCMQRSGTTPATQQQHLINSHISSYIPHVWCQMCSNINILSQCKQFLDICLCWCLLQNWTFYSLVYCHVTMSQCLMHMLLAQLGNALSMYIHLTVLCQCSVFNFLDAGFYLIKLF